MLHFPSFSELNNDIKGFLEFPIQTMRKKTIISSLCIHSKYHDAKIDEKERQNYDVENIENTMKFETNKNISEREREVYHHPLSSSLTITKTKIIHL